MIATKTISGWRYETYTEQVAAGNEPLNICVETGNVVVKTHLLPRVDVEARLRDVDLQVWQEGGSVYIQADNRKGSQLAGPERHKAEILVTVPANCPLFAQVVTGTLAVHDVKGLARTHVITGSTTLNNLSGPVCASIVTGTIKYFGYLADGTHRFMATTGSVRLALQEPPNARVYAWATTGRVQCEIPLSEKRRGGYLTGDHLYGVAGNGEGRVLAEVVTGSVHIGPVSA